MKTKAVQNRLHNLILPLIFLDGGMFCLLIFKHLGEIKNGIEELKEWGNAAESYHLSETNGITELVVRLQMEASSEFEQYFNDTFPKALEIVKQLAEQ